MKRKITEKMLAWKKTAMAEPHCWSMVRDMWEKLYCWWVRKQLHTAVILHTEDLKEADGILSFICRYIWQAYYKTGQQRRFRTEPALYKINLIGLMKYRNFFTIYEVIVCIFWNFEKLHTITGKFTTVRYRALLQFSGCRLSPDFHESMLSEAV